MDLGKWLRDRKKQVEGVVAQVNPFDGGKTYSSVTRRPTVDPFKSNNVNAKYGVLADKGRRDQFIQNNQRESFSTPIATFQSLRDIPGKIGNTLINNPIADKAADITGTNRQTSVEGRNSSDYLKPTGVIDNTVAAVSNLGQFNPIRSAGDIGQYLDTVSEKSRFKPVGDVIGNQTKDAANFGKPIEGSEWDARNLKNPVAKNAGEFSTMLGQTANFAVPVAGPLAVSGMIANEANETVNTARARGEDETIANLKGLLSGAGQAAVERYSSKLTTALPGSTKLAGLAKNKLIGIPASLAGGAITEGGEEFVQGLMGNAARGNDLTEGLKEQTIQGAKGGLLLGGFFGGANYAANRSQGTTQEAVQRVEQQNPTLQQTGIPAQPGSIRERIQQAKENVKSTIAETNQLLRQDDAGGYMGGTNAQDRINDPLESLKQEARKYKSAEEFFDNTWNRGLPTEDTVKFLDNTPDAKAWYKLLDEQKKSEPIARKALSDMESMRKKYVGKKNLKLTDAEKKSIDKQYNELAKTVQNHLDNYGGFNTNTGYVDGKGLLMESSTFDGATNAQKQLTDLYNEATKGAKSADPLEALKAEARKYKSAEEFVNSKINAYRATSETYNPLKVSLGGNKKQFGTYVTNDLETAKAYLDNRNTIIDNLHLTDKAKVATESDLPKKFRINELSDYKKFGGPQEWQQKAAKWAKDNGYDVMDFGGRNNMTVVNPEALKTKQQLTDLYNQATQSQPPKSTIESLKQEAGYRSAHQIDNKTARNLGDMQSVDDVVTQIKSKYGLTNNDQKDITNLKRIVGNPEADVKIYRASPVNEVNDGDWVTTSKTYANDIKRQNGGKVYEYTVKAKDLNLPSNIEDNPSLARFSAFQYSPVQKKQGGLRTLMRDEGGGYTGKTSQERIGQAKFDAELRAKSAANLKKANIQITQGVANPKSDSPLTDKAYSETFGVSLEEAKKDITSINTSKTNPLDSVGMTEQEATRKLESNAPTMSPGNKKTKSLVDSMINDKKLTEAARIAQKEGRELNYFAKKDNNGRSVGIEEYNPSRQRIEAGFVVDNSTGKVLGNHIKVDATGTQINVGGEVVNISDVVGNPLDWKGDYEVSSTMERNIFKNAPNKEIAQKTYKFVVANKIQAEATLRKEIESQRKTLNQNVKDVQKVKPWSVSDKDFKADIFDFIENKKSQADIASKYGPKATQAIVKYKNETRKLYDTLLDRANTELAKFGEKTIPKRSDYITHINELNQQPSFAGELMGQLQNSMLGEGYTTTRGGVPGDIAGRTENFSPRKRWNPFAQQRKGGEYTKDPFKAVDSYLEPTLYNIHMTESAVRARAVESAFRTAEILKNTEATKVSTDLDRELEKYKKQSNNAKLVSGFQEYANALAGKTQRWDRQVIDASKGTATALKGWQGLQRIGGRATILGNINSVLMQPLNQASVIAEVKLPNYIKGVASSLAGNNVEDKSPFIRARAAKIESAFRSKGQKVMDKAGIPLQFVELASVKLAWNAEYQQVLSEGLKGQDAIIEADRRTEKAVAGRGIADKPELYRSTLTNGLLQYTLEVNAQNKKFWRDLTPAQKGKFVVAAFGMNTVMEAVTGNEPLPDFLGAAIDTFRDFLDDDDDTPLENAGKGVQRFASEAVSMNPMLSAGANLLPDSTKKTLFGSDSDLTRFEGVPAPIGVIQNAVDVGKNVANGDVKKARDSALKLIPGGNQIRKTLQGKELIQDGGKYDKNGKLQYPAPESPLGKAQALLFGPSAIKNAREYYDSITDKISGISTKKDASGKTIDDFKTIAQSAFNTDKGKEFMALTNDDERKEFARQSSENRGIYEQYKSMQKAFNGGDDLLPEGLSKESEAILNKYDRMEAKTKEDIFYRENDAEYKYELAKYEKDKLEGTISEVDAIRKEKSLAKQAIGSKYEKGIRDVYSLSKEQIEDLVTGDPAGKAIYDKLVKYDKELYDAGLISYLKFKNGLASGRGGRGRDKKDTSLTDKYALQGQTLSRLQKLLAGTTFAGAETVTTPKTQKAKQKKITVNMKA